MNRKAQPPDTLFDIGQGIAINLREIAQRQRTSDDAILIVMKDGARYIRRQHQFSDLRIWHYLMDPSPTRIETLW